MDDPLGLADAAPKRRNDPREHRIQAFGHHLIGRIVSQPMLAMAIDHASLTTQNARARAKGRGVLFGCPDHIVWGTYCFRARGRVYSAHEPDHLYEDLRH